MSLPASPRRRWLGALALSAVPGVAASRSTPPARPLHIVVGVAAGSGGDAMARLVGTHLSAQLQRRVLVENRPGANALLASQYVARSVPDGSTLLFSYAAAMLVNPLLHGGRSVDPLLDFEPIAQIGSAGSLLVVAADLPAQDIRGLMAWIDTQARPGGYGSWGIGSGGHLLMEQLLRLTGRQLTHVPYSGTVKVLGGLLSGTIRVGMLDVASPMPHIRSGELRAIAVSGTHRLPQLPEVATMAEQGFPLTAMAWYGLFAPTGTPVAELARLEEAAQHMLRDSEFIARLEAVNFPRPPRITGRAFRDRIARDRTTWAEMLRAAGIDPDAGLRRINSSHRY